SVAHASRLAACLSTRLSGTPATPSLFIRRGSSWGASRSTPCAPFFACLACLARSSSAASLRWAMRPWMKPRSATGRVVMALRNGSGHDIRNHLRRLTCCGTKGRSWVPDGPEEGEQDLGRVLFAGRPIVPPALEGPARLAGHEDRELVVRVREAFGELGAAE